jgi:hypothetical protein
MGIMDNGETNNNKNKNTVATTATATTTQFPEYGFIGLYETNMPRLNALVYIVDAALPMIDHELHAHLFNIGIKTSLLYVPGWSLTLFTNRLKSKYFSGE